MNNEEGILLSLSLIVLIIVLGLTPFTEAGNVIAGGLNNRDAEWATTRAVVNLSSSPLPLDGGVTSSTSDRITKNPSSFSVHNLNTSENFSTIQEAIDAPNTTAGHIIEVDPETYTENVRVNKSLTIHSSSADPTTTIVQTPNASADVFTITADHVTISGFTIEGAVGDEKAGIHLSSPNNRITNNILTSNYYGIISVNASGNNTIADNNASLNVIGIALIGSSGNTIRDNLVEANSDFGIYLESSNDTIVTNNTARFTQLWSGISLWDSSDNKITHNTANSNEWSACGIELIGISSNNLIDNNSANSNGGSGIIFWDIIDNNTITNNTASYNKLGGIELYGGSHNIIKNNIANSNAAGISLWYYANNNTLENNMVIYNEYSGIELLYYNNHNTIKSNSASFNNVSGIALYRSSSNNIIAHNELSSNQFGLSIAQLADKFKPRNNQIENNTIRYSKYYGIYLLDLKQANNVTCNTVLNSNLFGILVENSSNNTIRANTANLNERGIGLVESRAIAVRDNVANSNKISGLSLLNSSANKIRNNIARFNVYEGVHLSNSDNNTITNNDVSGTHDSGSYFGISLYSSNNNDIGNNNAGSNYYFDVFQYSSTGNTISNNLIYTQPDEIRGVRVYVPEALTPSLQSVAPSTNETYAIVIENLGNMPDTFDLLISSSDDPDVLYLDTYNVSLGPREISANTTLYEKGIRIKMNVETIKLNVTDSVPGAYRVKVEAISSLDDAVKDSIETWTIVQGKDNKSYTSSDSQVIDSALLGSTITAGSTIDTSAIINSNISGSTITSSIIRNSEVVETTLSSVRVDNAIVNKGRISTGTITINGVTYEIDSEHRIADLVVGSDYEDSNLVGIKNEKMLKVSAENSNTNFAISAKDDYFAGSMRVQKSTIPPNGIPEDTDTIGGYIYANVSDNVANSTDWVIVKVFYDPNKLGDLDESSLRLIYFNETAEEWKEVPISGLNLAENYVWGNISHYSVFAVSGSVTPKKPSRPGGGHASTDSDDDGLSDIQELILGTDKNNTDTDGDGFNDGEDPFPLDPNLPLRLTSTPTVTLAPTITPTVPVPAPAATPEPTEPTPEEGKPRFEFPIPGFEALFAVGSLLAVAYLLLRRRR